MARKKFDEARVEKLMNGAFFNKVTSLVRQDIDTMDMSTIDGIFDDYVQAATLNHVDEIKVLDCTEEQDGFGDDTDLYVKGTMKVSVSLNGWEDATRIVRRSKYSDMDGLAVPGYMTMVYQYVFEANDRVNGRCTHLELTYID